MASLRRSTVSQGIPVVVIAAAIAVLLVGCGGSGRSRITIKIGRAATSVAPGTTVAQLAADYGLQPRAGNLLDINGAVLRRGAFPGRLLLNGEPVPGSTRLGDGDHVGAVAGRSRREKLTREVLPVPRGMPTNPQFVLAWTPGVEVVVRGAVSHELVSAHFRPDPGKQRLERAVALTFDDGPWPGQTARILAILRRFHVPATFFVIGYLVDANPDLVRLERKYGMVIGNHTYNHPEVPPFGRLPRRLVEDEITLAAESIQRAGATTQLLRTPGGSFSPTVLSAAQAAGERVVLWSVDPGDWHPGVTAGEVVHNVLSAVKPGSIVDMHDGGGDRTATIEALPRIIKGIRHRHLKLVAIPTG